MRKEPENDGTLFEKLWKNSRAFLHIKTPRLSLKITAALVLLLSTATVVIQEYPKQTIVIVKQMFDSLGENRVEFVGKDEITGLPTHDVIEKQNNGDWIEHCDGCGPAHRYLQKSSKAHVVTLVDRDRQVTITLDFRVHEIWEQWPGQPPLFAYFMPGSHSQ